jgi:hypothetical protein
MNNTRIIKLFKKFLIKHKAYEAYCVEMEERYNNIYAKLMKSSNPYNFIAGYFPWSQVTMSEEFWEDLDYEWSIFLQHNYKP